MLERVLPEREPAELLPALRSNDFKLLFIALSFEFRLRQEALLSFELRLDEHLRLFMRRRTFDIWRFCWRMADL